MEYYRYEPIRVFDKISSSSKEGNNGDLSNNSAVVCPSDRGIPGNVMTAYEGESMVVFRFSFSGYSSPDDQFKVTYAKVAISESEKTGIAHRISVSLPSVQRTLGVNIITLFTNPGETIFTAYVLGNESFPVHLFLKRVTLNRSLVPPVFSIERPDWTFNHEIGQLSLYFRKIIPELGVKT
jgi:hypothetical protein